MSKLVVVTGGTKGIGRAVIEKFAAQGFDVITCARSGEDLQALKKQVESKYRVGVMTLTVDMSRPDEVQLFTAEILKLNRPVDVLVNNAGFFSPGETLTEKVGALEGMIEANVYSAYHTTRGIVPAMQARKSGHVFNMCSIASITAYPNGGSYTISKFALLGYTKVLREELKQFGVRVTAVMPGATLTPSWDGTDLPEERFMSTEDVAEAIFGAYSLSERSVVEEILIRPQLGDI